MDKNLSNFLKKYKESYKEQLLRYEFKVLDNKNAILINENSEKLEYANINDNPLVIEPKTIEKIKTKHQLNLEFLIKLDELIDNSVFAFDSIQHDTSKIFVLNEKNNNNQIIFIVRENKQEKHILVNEVTSVYDKEKLQNLINITCNQGKNVYINPEKEIEFLSLNFSVPLNRIYNIDEISYETEREIYDKYNLTQEEKEKINTLNKWKSKSIDDEWER